MTPIHHAEWTIELGVEGVARRTFRKGCELPDAEAAIRGAFALIREDRLDAASASRIVPGLWGLWAPRPLQRIKA